MVEIFENSFFGLNQFNKQTLHSYSIIFGNFLFIKICMLEAREQGLLKGVGPAGTGTLNLNFCLLKFCLLPKCPNRLSA